MALDETQIEQALDEACARFTAAPDGTIFRDLLPGQLEPLQRFTMGDGKKVLRWTPDVTSPAPVLTAGPDDPPWPWLGSLQEDVNQPIAQVPMPTHTAFGRFWNGLCRRKLDEYKSEGGQIMGRLPEDAHALLASGREEFGYDFALTTAQIDMVFLRMDRPALRFLPALQHLVALDRRNQRVTGRQLRASLDRKFVKSSEHHRIDLFHCDGGDQNRNCLDIWMVATATATRVQHPHARVLQTGPHLYDLPDVAPDRLLDVRPGDVVRINKQTWHASPRCGRDQWRSFLRLTSTLDEEMLHDDPAQLELFEAHRGRLARQRPTRLRLTPGMTPPQSCFPG